MNLNIFISSTFITKLLAGNHFIIRERTKLTQQKSSKFLLEVITLVSPANNTGPDTEYILGGG